MSKLTALIVDDEELAREGLKLLLLDFPNIEIIGLCTNGIEAIKQANILNPDVIFLDIIMPKKDGLQLLKEIRKYEEEHSIVGRDGVKIIMTTALGDSKNVLSAFKSGCEGYIVKPYNRPQIYDKLDELGVNAPVG